MGEKLSQASKKRRKRAGIKYFRIFSPAKDLACAINKTKYMIKIPNQSYKRNNNDIIQCENEVVSAN